MRYDAFLSYSHAADAPLAASIQSALQRFARPWYKAYALRIFRDKTGLSANPALWESIARALDQAEHLLLLASPEAAASPWVKREIEWFLRNRPAGRILILLTGGQIAWDEAAADFDWRQTTALPRCLGGRFQEQPLYADFSWVLHGQQRSLDAARFRDAILDLASPLFGKPKDELDSEELRQHRRTLRTAWSAVALLSALAVALAAAAVYATRQRGAAERQTQVAIEQAHIAGQQRRLAEAQTRLAEERRLTALSRQLAAQAISEVAVHLDLALVEAVEATRISPTFEARNALLAVLLHSSHIRKILAPSPRTLSAAVLSSDGTLMAAVDEQGEGVFVESAKTALARRLAGEQGIRSLSLSPGGMLALGAPGKVAIRNIKTGTGRASITAGLGTGAPEVLAISADGARLAGYESGAGILLWDVGKRELRVPPLQPKRWEAALAFSPDGGMLASGAHDGSVVLWDTATGRPLGPPLAGHHSRVFSLAFSPDGKTLASGSEDRTLLLWDVKTGRALGPPMTGHAAWPLGNDAWGLSLAFSPDGALLASAAKDRSVILWDVRTREPIGPALRGHAAPPMTVAFSSDGRSLVSAGQDGSLIRWAVDPVSLIGLPVDGFGEGVTNLAFSPDGKSLAAASLDHQVMLWSRERRRLLDPPLGSLPSSILALSFNRDGGELHIAAKDRAAVWSLNGGHARTRRMAGAEDETSCAALSPDGTSLAWSDGATLLAAQGPAAPVRFPIARASSAHMVTSLAFSPDGQEIASGGFDGTVALWSAASRTLLWPAAKAHREPVRTLAFSPDGTMLASAGVSSADFDGSVRLWDTRTGRALLPPLAGHTGPVRTMAFSPDGKILACGAGDTVVLWDVASRQRLGDSMEGHSGPVLSIAFSPDGRWLASGGYDDRVIMWNLDLEAWRRSACAIANRSLDQAEWTRLIGDTLPYRKSCP